MSVKLTMYFVLGTTQENNWESVDLYDLTDAVIDLATSYLELVPHYLFFETNIKYESLQIMVNKKDNNLRLSMLVKSDKSVVEPLIKNYIPTIQYGPKYESQHSFNDITWNFDV
jgi:hypothetical protein